MNKPIKFRTRKAFDIPGHAHELTVSTKKRLPFFSNKAIADYFVANLSGIQNEHKLEVLAYVVMPEHCHILIFPTEENYSISNILSEIKSPVAKHAFAICPELRELCRVVRPHKGTEYQFWQPGGGYDRNMWRMRRLLIALLTFTTIR